MCAGTCAGTCAMAEELGGGSHLVGIQKSVFVVGLEGKVSTFTADGKKPSLGIVEDDSFDSWPNGSSHWTKVSYWAVKLPDMAVYFGW